MFKWLRFVGRLTRMVAGTLVLIIGSAVMFVGLAVLTGGVWLQRGRQAAMATWKGKP